MYVNAVNVLIHPGSHRNWDNNGATKQQQKLFQKWDNWTEGLQDRPNDIFVYVSDLTKDNLYGSDDLNVRHRDEEKARIVRYQEMLSDRFILLTKEPDSIEIKNPEERLKEIAVGENISFPARDNANQLKRIIDERGIVISKETEMHYFGEYTASCVPDWGNAIRTKLGILEKRTYLHKELSLDTRTFLERVKPAIGLPSLGIPRLG